MKSYLAFLIPALVLTFSVASCSSDSPSETSSPASVTVAASPASAPTISKPVAHSKDKETSAALLRYLKENFGSEATGVDVPWFHCISKVEVSDDGSTTMADVYTNLRQHNVHLDSDEDAQTNADAGGIMAACFQSNLGISQVNIWGWNPAGQALLRSKGGMFEKLP